MKHNFKVGDELIIKDGSAFSIKNWEYGGMRAVVVGILDDGYSILTQLENGQRHAFNYAWLKNKYKWEEL